MKKLWMLAWCMSVAGGMLAGDWIVDPSPYVASAGLENGRLVMDNGLIRRELLLAPNAATLSVKCVTTGEEYIRAFKPEAQLCIDGKWFDVGGVEGQPILNYILPEWLPQLKTSPNSYRYRSFTIGEVKERFPWKRRPEWMSHELAWPPKGKEVTLAFTAPSPNLPELEIHYEIYDGAPIIGKWFTLKNTTGREIRIDTYRSELLRLAEAHGNSDIDHSERPNDLWCISELFFADASSEGRELGMQYTADSSYRTQESYMLTRKNHLQTSPCGSFAHFLKPGEGMDSIRTWEMAMDSTERERRGLSIRRFWRLMAPWTDENPLIFHLKASGDAQVRAGIEQCKATGFETLLMSFGSGFNLESADPAYRARYAKLSAEAKAAGIALGGYSLTSSRGAATAADNVQGSCRYGRAPCLGAQWGVDYLKGLKDFMKGADFGIFENDGPYPGDICSSTAHPYHHGAADSFRVQWEAQRDLYRFCRAHGIYVNQPDSYYLNGGSKNGMGYRETCWSEPRERQVLIERQNIYDGTWAKTSSMGWMFVPLCQYHGGGAAAVVEPLHEHLRHYEQRFADTLGAGVQACWRGPRLYDCEETRLMVRKWTDFYKKHRSVLTGDFIHLRRADGRDWDGWLMCDAKAKGEVKAIAMLFNPLKQPISRTVKLPLHYAGLSGEVKVAVDGAEPRAVTVDSRESIAVPVTIPAEGHVRVLIGK